MLTQQDLALIADEYADIYGACYFDTAMTAVPPKLVQAEYTGFMNSIIVNRGKDNAWVRDRMAAARESISQLLGCMRDEIAFVKNTAEGMGILAAGLDWRAGSNIVVCAAEHESNLFCWMELQKKGVELKLIHGPIGGLQDSDILDAIDENTALVALSAVQYTDGFYADIKRIGQACKSVGALLAVDGMHAAGRLGIHVSEMMIDYLACGAHKGMHALHGCGFVYCSRALVGRITPPYASFQSISRYNNLLDTHDTQGIHWHEDARRLESGNLNFSGIFAMGASAAFKNALGIKNIEVHILHTEAEIVRAIGQTDRLTYNPLRPSGTFCVLFDEGNADRAQAIMVEHKVYATVRRNHMRISVDCFNTMSEGEQAARSARAILTLPYTERS